MTATRTETPRAMSEASQALIRTTPSRTNRASNGSMATRAVMNSDPATASRTGRNMGNTSVCCGVRLPLGDAEVCWGQTPDRGVEHLDGVGERQLSSGALDRGRHLHQAAGVGGDEHLCACRHDVPGLAVTELSGRFGVEDVVDPRRSAAQLGLVDLLELEARYATEQLPGLGPDALGVPEVAGVVVGDGDLEWMAFGDGRDLGEE